MSAEPPKPVGCNYVTFPDDTWPAKCDKGWVVNISVGYRRPCPQCQPATTGVPT